MKTAVSVSMIEATLLIPADPTSGKVKLCFNCAVRGVVAAEEPEVQSRAKMPTWPDHKINQSDESDKTLQAIILSPDVIE